MHELPQTLDWQDAEKLLEWRVRPRIGVAVDVGCELSDHGFAFQEIPLDVVAQVRDHRGVVVRVVPSPVLYALVVVEENPLEALNVGEEHLSELSLALGFADVELQLLLVVVPFGLVAVLSVRHHEILHEALVLVDVLLGLLLRELELGLQVLRLLDLINHLVANACHLRVTDVTDL